MVNNYDVYYGCVIDMVTPGTYGTPARLHDRPSDQRAPLHSYREPCTIRAIYAFVQPQKPPLFSTPLNIHSIRIDFAPVLGTITCAGASAPEKGSHVEREHQACVRVPRAFKLASVATMCGMFARSKANYVCVCVCVWNECMDECARV